MSFLQQKIIFISKTDFKGSLALGKKFKLIIFLWHLGNIIRQPRRIERSAWYNNNFFSMCTGKYCRGLNTNRVCGVRAITGGNISIQIEKKNCFYCPKMLKIYQEETKLFEFSQDTNKEELKIKNDVILQWLHFVIVSLCNDTTSLCSGCVTFKNRRGC